MRCPNSWYRSIHKKTPQCLNHQKRFASDSRGGFENARSLKRKPKMARYVGWLLGSLATLRRTDYSVVWYKRIVGNISTQTPLFRPSGTRAFPASAAPQTVHNNPDAFSNSNVTSGNLGHSLSRLSRLKVRERHQTSAMSSLRSRYQ